MHESMYIFCKFHFPQQKLVSHTNATFTVVYIYRDCYDNLYNACMQSAFHNIILAYANHQLIEHPYKRSFH